MTLTPQTHVRVIRGAHAGRDGKILSISHGVCEVESWLDREEILICLEADVVPLADAPRCAHCVERERRVDDLRAVLSRLVDTLPKCSLCGEIATGEGGGGMGDPDEPECDKHGGDNYEYADALRAALAVLGRGPHG